MRILIILSSIFYLNVNAAELEGCEAIKDQFSYKITMSEEYIEKFQDYDAAEKHCWDWKVGAQEIDVFSIDCMARQDDDFGITTYMSTRFSSQYENAESAMQECWWLYGIQESPADYKFLSRTTSTDISFSYHMHLDHIDDYQNNQNKRQKLVISGVAGQQKDHEDPQSDSVESLPDPIICDFMERPGVEIKILDSQSYENLTCKANVQAINNDLDGYSEKLDNINCQFGYLQGLMELPGNYEITVDVPGYVQQKHDIEVDQDECHVKTVKIDLLLDRI